MNGLKQDKLANNTKSYIIAVVDKKCNKSISEQIKDYFTTMCKQF